MAARHGWRHARRLQRNKQHMRSSAAWQAWRKLYAHRRQPSHGMAACYSYTVYYYQIETAAYSDL